MAPKRRFAPGANDDEASSSRHRPPALRPSGGNQRGLHIGEAARGGAALPQPPPLLLEPKPESSEEDPDLRAAVMISAAEEEAKWPHLHAAIRTSEMEEAELYAQALQARREEEEEAARREEARRRADEERRQEQRRQEDRRHADQRRRQEARRRAWQERQQRLREEALLRAPPQPRVAPDPHSPWEEALWSPWPESPARSSHNSASPPGDDDVADDAHRG